MSRTALFIHGAFAGGHYFDWLTTPFAEQGWRCIAPHLRHHGPGVEAPPELAATGLKEYLADLEAVIDGLDEPPVLVGHSMGGLLAQMLAARGRAAAAVLLAPCAPWGVLPASHTEVGAAYGLFHMGEFWNRVLYPDFDVAAPLALDGLPPEAQQRAFAGFGPESGRALFQTLCWGLDFSATSAVDARRVECPILCLVGSEDKVVSPGTVRSIASKYRRVSTFEVIDGLSHYVGGEPAAAGLPNLMQSWLDEVL